MFDPFISWKGLDLNKICLHTSQREFYKGHKEKKIIKAGWKINPPHTQRENNFFWHLGDTCFCRFLTGIKKKHAVENDSMNIPIMFCFNWTQWFFGEEDWNVNVFRRQSHSDDISSCESLIRVTLGLRMRITRMDLCPGLQVS